MLGLPHQNQQKEAALSILSATELTKLRDLLARALPLEEVNQLGRDTAQAQRLRTVTPHRLFLAVVSMLAGAQVESLADLLRAFKTASRWHTKRSITASRVRALRPSCTACLTDWWSAWAWRP